MRKFMALSCFLCVMATNMASANTEPVCDGEEVIPDEMMQKVCKFVPEFPLCKYLDQM